MNHRHVLTLAAVVLLAVPAVTMGVSAISGQGSPHLMASLTDNRVTPGADTTLSVKLVNDAKIQDADVGSSYASIKSELTTARGVTVTMVDDGLPVSVENRQTTFGSLKDGASQAVDFDVSVDSDAEPGVYEVPLYVEYRYTDYISSNDGTHDTRRVNRSFDLRLRVLDDARFQILDVKSNARVGATGTVTLTMKNTGSDDASATRVTLTSNNGALTLGGSSSATRYVGEWTAGTREKVRFRVATGAGASNQRYSFEVTTSYENEDGEAKTSETMQLGVRPEREQEFAVVGVDSDVAVDDTGTLNVTLRNDGPVTARDATVTLTSNNADVTFGKQSTATRYVGRWEAGDTHSIQVETSASGDAETNTYALSATVDYEDGEGDPETSESLSFGFTPDQERQFEASGLTSNLRVGEEGRLKGTITNTGESTADDVVVVFDTDTQNVNPLETEYSVGTLKPGESAQFAFDVEISDSAEAGPKQFTLHPEYRNTENQLRNGDDIVTRQRVAPSTDVFELETNNATLQRGSSGALSVAVTNNGNETVTDVSAKVFADDPISVTDSEAFIKRLQPGETERVTFKLSAAGSAIAKSYPISIDFQYDDADGDTLLSDTYRLPVTVNGGSSGGNSASTLPLVGVAAVLIALGGGYYWYRRR